MHSTALLLYNAIREVLPQYCDEYSSKSRTLMKSDPYARAVVIDVLRNTLEKASKYNIKEQVIAANITNAMKATNNSHIGIRRSAYEAITVVAELLPESKQAARCRKAINKALAGLEKDPSLLKFLDECRIRALPPKFIR